MYYYYYYVLCVKQSVSRTLVCLHLDVSADRRGFEMLSCFCVSARQTHTQTHTHTHTDTHTDTTDTHKHTNTHQTQTHTDTDTHKHTNTTQTQNTHTQTHTKTNNTHTHTHRHRHTHTHRHRHTQTTPHHTHTTHRSRCFENTRPNAALFYLQTRLKPEVSPADPGGTYEGTMTIFRLDSGETPGPPGLGAASLTNGQSHTGELWGVASLLSRYLRFFWRARRCCRITVNHWVLSFKAPFQRKLHFILFTQTSAVFLWAPDLCY